MKKRVPVGGGGLMNAALSGGLELKPGAPAQFKLSPLVLAGFSALALSLRRGSGPSYLFTRRRRLINRLISNTIHPGH